MDKNAIRKFAISARRDLIDRVRQRAERFGISEDAPIDERAQAFHGRVMIGAEPAQRRALITRIKKDGYPQVMEEAAYTWFNRFIALRFMEVNGYLPSRVRVFSDEGGAFNPQLLTEALHVDLYGLDIEKVFALEEANAKEELFKYLLITQCNDIGRMLPGLFEKIADYTELLFPDNLLREGSVIEQMVTAIPEEDWKDAVQIIGWLYQYYNTEPKDKVFADLKKNIKISKEKIPAATQLFTPDWIVRYMVENSLGRLWIEHLRAVEDSGTLDLSARSVEASLSDDGILSIGSIGEFAIKDNWKYYLDEAPQEPEVEAQLKEIRAQYAQLDPAQILCCDPCMGSGHILVYMFDVLMQIYLACGWTTNEAVESIIRNNLWGMDIDDRAAQLAYFAVMMKAQQYDNRWLAKQLRRPVQPNVFALQDSPDNVNTPFLGYGRTDGDYCTSIAWRVLGAFEDAKEYGSIIQPNVTIEELDFLSERLDTIMRDAEGQAMDYQAEAKALFNAMWPQIRQCRALVQKYHVVVTNPPYAGCRGLSDNLYDHLVNQYSIGKYDLFSVFILKCIYMTLFGYTAIVTPESWMFLSSFAKLREYVLHNRTLSSILHLGEGGFDNGFGTAVAVIAKNHIQDYKSSSVRLVDCEDKEKGYNENAIVYQKNNSMFEIYPGSVIAYWCSKTMDSIFSTSVRFGSVADPRQGIATMDNNRFVRLWHEVATNSIGFNMESASEALKSRCRWFPYNKGGMPRRWYGNRDCVVNWYNDGQELKKMASDLFGSYTKRICNTQLFFKPLITWSKIAFGNFAVRLIQNGFCFDVAGCSIAVDDDRRLKILGYLNSKVVKTFLQILSPTLNAEVGQIRMLPLPEGFININDANLDHIPLECVYLSQIDWDSFETSWDFQRHPLVRCCEKLHETMQAGLDVLGPLTAGVRPPVLLALCFELWKAECNDRFNQLKANEEELNRIFIDIYGLQDELTPEVEDKDVTVHRADLGRDIRSLISYAVGCMFGRYSLDEPGLILAGQKYSDKFAHASVPVAGGGPLYTARGDCYLIRGEKDLVPCSFAPDVDGILPITDDEYFTDDIVTMFVDWVKTVYGAETLEDNLKFIADALGGKGSPREVLRQYFLNDFYKDHLKVYQKRPIYWLFDSGKKNGFKCLIYMHRYQPDTLARIRTDYVHELQGRYRNAIDTLERQIMSATASSERVKLQKRLTALKAQAEEIRVYEEKIHHLADQMIKIDLDDGVKHNYTIFKDVLAPIK